MAIQVDFNSARVEACRSYNKLVKTLNDYIDDGELRIDANQLDDCFAELRNDLIVIAATSMDGIDDFACVMDQVTMVDYNPDGEDDG